MEAAWPLAGELFRTHEIEHRMAGAGVGVDPSAVRTEFDQVLGEVLAAAMLRRPGPPPQPPRSERTGRHGVHSEAMGDLLTELQSVAGAHPGATW